MIAALLAGIAAALAVAGASQAIAALAGLEPRRALAPLRAVLGQGLEPSAAQRRELALLGGGCLTVAGALIGGFLLALVLGALGPLAATAVVRIARARWRRELAATAPAAARAIADALSGGNGAIAAVALAAASGAVPGAGARALTTVARAVELGGDPAERLAALARQAADPSWEAIAAAITIQRRAGGDLARLLRRVAAVADERERAEADARAATAQARFTAWLVAGMPLAGALIGALVAPGTVAAVAAEPISLMLVIAAGALMAASLAAIQRLARPAR